MAEEKKPTLADTFRALGSAPTVAPQLSPPITEEMIARGVAKGLAEAAAVSVEGNRDLWLRFYAGAAPLATRVGIVPYSGTLRIAFGEQYDQSAPTQFRAAVTLPDYNAWELWKLLGQNPAVQHWEEEYQKRQDAAGADGDKSE